jgi:EAL domain-containing protein (putative c-di-GMP-specific phosphodiesterase class I)
MALSPPRELEDEDLETLGLRTEYQPIVDLATGTVVGYEALTRGRRGSRFERPDHLLAAARAAGRLVELDSYLRHVAFETAAEAGLVAPSTLFVNCEPETAARLGELDQIWSREGRPFESITEITERALSDDPGRLMAAVDELRELGWGVALDDIGFDARAVALLPFLRPDVVKLDLRVVQERLTTDLAGAIAALNAYAERSGAALLAEGIETEEHLANAIALGATFGQGYLFGRPAPLPEHIGQPGTRVPNLPPPSATRRLRPFALLGADRPPRVAGGVLLESIAGHLLSQAENLGAGAIVLALIDGEPGFREARLAELAALDGCGAFVAAVGDGMPLVPAVGVRGGALPGDGGPSDWSLVVLDCNYAAALIARAMDGGHYEYVLTHDRTLVLEAAQVLMTHVSPEGGPGAP